MTFLISGSTICFICGLPIATRVEAAQLPYASPDDVGELAHHGRSWVHRACWTSWPQRSAWSRSTARLMTSRPEILAARGVMAMATRDGVLVTDTGAAFAVTVPRSSIDELREAFGAGRPTTVAFDHALWTLTPTGTETHLAATHDDEAFEDLMIEDPDAWRQVLRQANPAGAPRPASEAPDAH